MHRVAPGMRRVAVALLALLTAAGQLPHSAPMAATPVARLDQPWWRRRFEEKQARLRQGHVDLVFYGDSITQDWESRGPPAWADFRPVWDRYYGDRNAVNLGFGGDTTADLLWRIEHGEAAFMAPKAAVVLIGANNLYHPDWSAEDTLAGIETDVAAIRSRLPRTRILLLAILPAERPPVATRIAGEVNQALAARYAGSAEVRFLNLAAVFMKDGELDRTQFLDPLKTPPDPALHPTAQAQARMAEAIEPVLSQMLGEHAHAR